MTTPSREEIDRIAQQRDPIIRNLQITQCYYEISQCVAECIGLSANWCTFATWASKQAGQTIRQEDLIRAFEERFNMSSEISAALGNIMSHLNRLGARLEARLPRDVILQSLNPAAAFARASDAVARGNKKVFEEIGREFARFLGVFRGDTHFDRDKTARFCAALRPGEPPNGQRLLSESFTTCCEARVQTGKEKAEMILLANLCAGFHEQIRLQPEIAEALNAALGSADELKRNLLTSLMPGFQSHPRWSELLHHRTDLDRVFDRFSDLVNGLIRQVITDHLMTLHLSGTEVLRLGRDLPGKFPEVLGQISNARLREMLAQVDLTPDSLIGSGADDWADFPGRMHFIADFFRVYQEQQQLFDAPFTTEQVARIKSGERPDGPL
jgi:hypothetical protein